MALTSVGPQVEAWFPLKGDAERLGKSGDVAGKWMLASVGHSSDETKDNGTAQEFSSGDFSRQATFESAGWSGSGGTAQRGSGSGGDGSGDQAEDGSCSDTSRQPSNESTPLGGKKQVGATDQAGAKITEAQMSPDEEKHGSFIVDGASYSIGSARHDDGDCKPCAFYCYSKSGCRDGRGCIFCHDEHKSKLRQRKEAWKQTRKVMHRERLDRRRDGEIPASTSEHQYEDGWGERDSPPVEVANAIGAAQAVPRVEPRVAYIQNVAVSPAPGLVLGPSSQQGPSQASHEVDFLQSVLHALEHPSPQANGLGHTLGHPSPPANSVPSFPTAGVPNDLGALMKSLSNPHGSLPFGAVNEGGAVPKSMAKIKRVLPTGMVAPSGNDQGSFAYTASDVVVAVGQEVELWPVERRTSSTLLYAVSPDLPRGLMIDKFTGLIHGSPQEATQGDCTYFVALCEPTFNGTTVKMSILQINVVAVARRSAAMTLNSNAHFERQMTAPGLSLPIIDMTVNHNQTPQVQRLTAETEALVAQLRELASQQNTKAKTQSQARALAQTRKQLLQVAENLRIVQQGTSPQ